jgi:hypothetical protein
MTGTSYRGIDSELTERPGYDLYLRGPEFNGGMKVHSSLLNMVLHDD